MEGKPLTLYELNSLVRGVIESTLNAGYWVEAELSEAREVRGIVTWNSSRRNRSPPLLWHVLQPSVGRTVGVRYDPSLNA